MSRDGFSLRSKIGVARTGTNSLRATVPQGIVAFLELVEHDKLEWKMEYDKETQTRFVTVQKKSVEVEKKRKRKR